MDDFKVLLYIVVAIIWVVYNNYKKISEASRKRDLSKPPAEVIQENWPEKKSQPVQQPAQRRKETIERQRHENTRRVMERRPVLVRKPLQQKFVRKSEQPVLSEFTTHEGGVIIPSKVVQFQEQGAVMEEQNAIIYAIKNMDLRYGIVLSEILKRPYN